MAKENARNPAWTAAYNGLGKIREFIYVLRN